MKPHELTIQQAQDDQPWTVPYSHRLLVANMTVPHLLTTHAVMHAAKSVGKLAAVYEALDHSGHEINNDQLQVVKDMAADLMTIAIRLSNLEGFNLVEEYVRRVEEKNAVNVLNMEKHDAGSQS